MCNVSDSLGQIVNKYLAAKSNEIAAIDARRKFAEELVEAAVAALGEPKPEKGSVTVRYAAGIDRAPGKLTLRFGVNRRITDLPRLQALVDQGMCPELLRTKYEINESVWEELRAQDPQFFLQLCECVSTSPASPEIKIQT